jgi:aspartyl-tRNA(Asn)/glutamyl-tRNA(Gln) amidotransferase subunit B
MDYEIVIGLEVHAQLLTKSKMFCSCGTDYTNAEPNTHVCPVCLGMPGVLPVINRKAVEYTVMTALALSCTVPEYTKFDRKNYCYPDLMKGYQISQYDAPIGINGCLIIDSGAVKKKIGITRVHLEEDVAKSWHRGDYSLIDVNRAGIPLMETVSEPDIRSPEEARDYLIKIRNILRYLGVSTGNMEEGSFRCDANISLRPRGTKQLFSKVEVKNLNSFKAVYQSMKYEAKRQKKLLEQGGNPVQETRGWIEEEGVTVVQRSKEYADDYRYFPEPDLPPIILERAWVEGINAKLPELPEAKRERFMVQYGLPSYDASILTTSKALAVYFEEILKVAGNGKAKVVSNWLLGDFSRLLNLNALDVESTKVSPEHLVEMLELIDKGVINGPATKTVFEEMFYSGKHASEIIKEKGLNQINDADELKAVIKRVIEDNAKSVADFRNGKQQALTFLVGHVMKATRGRANPAMVKDILMQELGEK